MAQSRNTLVLDPHAPAFVPSQTAIHPPNSSTYVHTRDPPHKKNGSLGKESMSSSEALTNSAISQQTVSRNAPIHINPLSQVPLYGSTHGVFYDPATMKFVGRGPPRDEPAEYSGIGPSVPPLTSMSGASLSMNKQNDQDQLHLQSKVFIDGALAEFGKNGPVQTIQLEMPSHIIVQEALAGSAVPLGREVDLVMLADGDEGTSGDTKHSQK